MLGLAVTSYSVSHRKHAEGLAVGNCVNKVGFCPMIIQAVHGVKCMD